MSTLLVDLTPQQLAACGTDHDRWLAVSAGAGAGKTKVLSARMVCLLERGEPLAGIVAMTFTRKAAQEMQTRVRRMMDDRIAELECSGSGGTALANLRSAREEFHRNRITTIDSFCRTQLLSAALEAGLPPGFDQLDEFAEAQARRKAVESMLGEFTPRMREMLEQGSVSGVPVAVAGRVADLLELHRGFGAEAVRDILATMLFQEDAWCAAMDALCIGDGRDVERCRAAEQQWVTSLPGRVALLAAAVAASLPWVAATGTSDPAEGVRAIRRVAAEVRKRPSEYLKWGEWLLAFAGTLPDDGLPSQQWAESLAGLPRGLGAGKAAKLLLEEHGCEGTALTALKNSVAASSDALAIDESLERRWFQTMVKCARVLPDLRRHFEAARGEGLTFSDLKRLLLRFITPGPADGPVPARDDVISLRNARAVAGGISWLMVDEFQDTDPTQWLLFTRIVDVSHSHGSRRGINLFVVGDDKQSIYRFRGADASVFEMAKHYVARHNEGVQSPPCRHPLSGAPIAFNDDPGGQIDAAQAASGLVRLTANFRSRSLPLLTGNHVFDRMLRLVEWDSNQPVRGPESHDAVAQDLEPGNPGGKPDDPRPLVQLVPFLPVRGEANGDETGDQDGLPGDDSPTVLPTGNLAEARLCARLVDDLRQQDKLRAWSDAAVLVITNDQADMIRDALAARGIPYSVSGGKGLLKRQETHDMWALAAAIDHPDDDIALAALLRSPACGVSDAGLLTFRHAATDGRHHRGIWQCLRDRDAWHPAVTQIDRERMESGLPGSGDASRLILAHDRLRDWRRRADYTRPSDLVRGILTELGTDAHGAGPGFAQRAANISVLLGLFRTIESGGGTLGDCADWLRERLDTEDVSLSEGQPELKAGTGGGVQVMTIHQAKGKEFGTVILPFLGTPSRRHRDSIQITTSRRAGALAALDPAWIQPGDKTDYSPLACRLIAHHNHAEALAEARRLLYVSWTRAVAGVVVLVPAIRASKSGKSNAGDDVPHPDPDGAYCPADLLCAALGVRRGEAHLAGDLAKRMRPGHLPHPARNQTANNAVLSALAEVEVPGMQEAGALPLAPDYPRRMLVSRLSTGMVPGDLDIDLLAGMSELAQSLVAPVSGHPIPPPSPVLEETGTGMPVPDVPLPRMDPADPLESWLHTASVGRSELLATEFGTIVHELARIALKSGLIAFTTPGKAGSIDRLSRDWMQSAIRGISGRLRPGMAVTQQQVDALLQHGTNACRLLATRTCTGNLLLEHELTGHESDRRLDCALETVPGHWLVIDFKTSPAASDRNQEYARQLHDYACLLARYFAMTGQPCETISTVLLHTGEAGSWGAEVTHPISQLTTGRQGEYRVANQATR
jgi:ATP-dependent helicase/nuclease subunit A